MAATPPQSGLNRKPPGPKPRASYLVGLIGRGIQASKSPTMHRSEAAAQGFELAYELLDFDQRGLPDESLPEVLNEAERRGSHGVHVLRDDPHARVQRGEAMRLHASGASRARGRGRAAVAQATCRLARRNGP